MSTSSLLFTALAFLVVGCSGTAVGTDPGTTSGAPGGASPGSPTEGSTGTVTDSTGPVSYDALFDAPTTQTITDDVVTGLWGGSAGWADVRLKLGTSSATIAVRCPYSGAVGADVAANVSLSAIRILSSKEVRGNPNCYFEVRPRTIPRCSASGATTECFSISGSTLRMHGVRLFTVGYSGGASTHDEAFTKLSD